MPAYYNENDPKAAAWLRELIKHNLIAPGEVDERSIEHIDGSSLDGFTQHHFFAGIGGWSYALRLAGWPDDQPVWTGSCPCQPFSVAGHSLGTSDPRHLWPHFKCLISQCRPPAIFGEQVASPLGREWLAGVFADLEAMGYAVGAADLCAAGSGSPHKRQRLYWMAHSNSGGRNPGRGEQSEGSELESRNGFTEQRSSVGGMVLTNGTGSQPGRQTTEGNGYGHSAESAGGDGFGMGNAYGQGSQGRIERNGSGGKQLVRPSSAWGDYELCHFTDGKTRRVESGTFPLADGVSNRVVKLCGLGNAIVPQVAATFIQASVEAMNEVPHVL